MRRRPHALRLALAAAAAVLLVGACGATGSTGEAGSTTLGGSTVPAASTTTVATTPSSTAPAPPRTVIPGITTPPATTPVTRPAEVGALDWDGVHYDFGRITAVRRLGSNVVIDFDRVQLLTENGPKSAPDFTEEPILVGNSDVETQNGSTKTRAYVLEPQAEVLTLANRLTLDCGGRPDGDPPQWRTGDVASLVASGPPDSEQVALTFDADGHISRVRVAESC